MRTLANRRSSFCTIFRSRRSLIKSTPIFLAEPLEARRLLSGTLADLSAAAQSTISSAIGQDQSAYHAASGATGVTLANPTNHFSAQLQSGILRISAGSDTWDMTLQGVSYGGSVQSVGTAQTSFNANRVDNNYGTVDEWYVNGPNGLEQGFTLSPLPQPDATGSLTVVLALSGDLTSTVNAAGNGLTLSRTDGSVVLGYTGLTARDATGKALPASLEVQAVGGRQNLLIHVNDTGAQGLITIDPWVQQAELTASDGTTGDYFGASVSISGNTVVVGADNAAINGNAGQGAAYVFTESASGWTNMTQTAKLTASDGGPSNWFGYAVAISGNTIVVGAPQASVGGTGFVGAAYVFTEPASGWTNMTQTAKLTASDAGDFFGSSVAIDGSTVVVGADWAIVKGNTQQGAAYIFTKPVSGWGNMTQTAKLTASDGAAYNDFGYSLSINGQTVLVGTGGSMSGGAYQGAAYVFAEPGSGWANMTQTSELTASDGATNDAFGGSVSISGNTAVVGAESATVGSNTMQGVAYVFTKPSIGWRNMTQTAKLSASDGGANAAFGQSVSISGTTIVVGAGSSSVNGNTQQGAAYVFTEPGSGWANMTQTVELTAIDGAGDSGFGESVSIDGDMVAVGALSRIAYVFTIVTAPITLHSFPDGNHPIGIAVDSAGNLYGTSEFGGDADGGTLWELGEGNATLNTLYAFLGQPLPYFPRQITIDSGGNIYGTANSGGYYGWGCVWELANGSSTPTTLYSFTGGTDGTRPDGITIDSAGNLYGTTDGAGSLNFTSTVWELPKGSGELTTMYTFAHEYDDWALGPITIDSNGNLYGAINSGDDNGGVTVWELAKGSGSPATLSVLSGLLSQVEGLAIDSAGNLYGTSENGGTYNDGFVWKLAKGSNTISMLWTFTGGTDGADPQGITIGNGNLYGTTAVPDGPGIVYELAGVIPAAPSFSNLSVSPRITRGTATVVFSGTVVGNTSMPTGNVAIMLNGVTQDAPINAQGNFTTTFNTSTLPASNTPYQVTYTYAGDANFNSTADNTTTTLLVMPTNGTQTPVYRLYSQVTKEHLYTADLNEYNTLGTRGWDQEGLAYDDYTGLITVGGVTTEPLYRLYNIPTQQHLWTTDANEYNTLKNFVGTWSVDGISGYIFPANGNTSTSLAAVPGSAALYRMSWPFNPSADLHLWTTDLNEYNTDAATYGWTKEGVIGYVM